MKNMEEKESKKLYYLMLKMSTKKDQVIYEQGQPSDKVFFVDDGEFQLSREQDREEYQVEEYQDTVSLYRKQTATPLPIPILNLSQGQMFGDLEAVLETGRHTRVTCTSTTGLLYYLPKEAFLKALSDLHPILYARKAVYQD